MILTGGGPGGTEGCLAAAAGGARRVVWLPLPGAPGGLSRALSGTPGRKSKMGPVSYQKPYDYEFICFLAGSEIL